MTTSSFRRLLSVNAVSSIVGAAIQAATAPIFLFVLSIGQFASILLAQTVATYVVFLLNGFYYYMMNSITHDYFNNRFDQARQMYTLGYCSILALFAVAGVGACLSWLLFDGDRVRLVMIWVAVLGAIVNLNYILVDANFRAQDRYSVGTSILTTARAIDFLIISFVVVTTRDPLIALVSSLAGRLLTLAALKQLAELGQGAVLLSRPMLTKQEVGHHLVSAGGQLGLSAFTALSIMGPQLVLSAWFPDHLAVTFNVHRTYMRVTTTLVNVVAASSWPVLNRLYASGETSSLRRFLVRLSAQTLALGLLLFVILFFAAPILFPVLFHRKVIVNDYYLVLIGLACIFSGATTMAQTVYLATNLRSSYVLLALGLTLAELSVFVITGLSVSFVVSLLIYAVFELIIMIVAMFGSLHTLQKVR